MVAKERSNRARLAWVVALGVLLAFIAYAVGTFLSKTICIGSGTECSGVHAPAPGFGQALRWLSLVLLVATVVAAVRIARGGNRD